MRPFEILSCLLEIAAMSVMLFAPARHRAVRILSLLMIAGLVAHAVFEGPHWQLIPLYVSSVFLAFYALAGKNWKRWLTAVFGVSCYLLLAFSLVLCWLMPMFRLPRPTGQFSVGTQIFHLVDSSRTEENGPSPSGKRELMVQAWYPAKPRFKDRHAEYQRVREVTERASYRSVLKTNSYEDAPVHAGGPYPVIIYNPGWNGERTEGTYQTEELASHGFIVVAVDHTFFGGLVEFPDGRVVDSRNAPNIGNFEHSSVEEQWALGGKYVRIEAQDDVFVLDRLEAMNQDPASPFFQQIDMQRVGVLGFSIGGAAAVQMAYQDQRVKCVMNMDGWEFGDAAAHDLNKPQMVVYEDKRGVLPKEPAAGSGTPEERKTWQFSLEDYGHVTASMRKHGGYLLFIAGTHHVDFTDRSLFSPIHKWTGRGSVAPRRVHGIVNAYALAFFSRYLKGENQPLLDAAPGNPGAGKDVPYSEVEYQHFDGGSDSTPHP
jgi:dienelactone hydrolase